MIEKKIAIIIIIISIAILIFSSYKYFQEKDAREILIKSEKSAIDLLATNQSDIKSENTQNTNQNISEKKIEILRNPFIEESQTTNTENQSKQNFIRKKINESSKKSEDQTFNNSETKTEQHKSIQQPLNLQMFNLTGIMETKNGKYAIINNEILKEGMYFSGVYISKILPTAVIIKYGETEYKITK